MIYRQNAIVLEMRNFNPVTWRGGRTYGRFCENQRALSIYGKNPEISVVAKVEFPIGKKLFHLVVNPGMWPGARSWTWNWYKLQETSMEHDIPFGNSNRENGTTFLDFPLFLGISSGTNRRNVFHLPPNRKFRKFWLNGKRPRRLRVLSNVIFWSTFYDMLSKLSI